MLVGLVLSCPPIAKPAVAVPAPDLNPKVTGILGVAVQADPSYSSDAAV